MTPLEFVERERARLRRLHILAGASLALAITFAALALAVLVLGNARWIALPRSAPFAVWLLIGVLDVSVILWSWRRLKQDVTRGGVAATIEREQTLRAGALRAALEVADRGTLGRHAASEMSTRLRGAEGALAPVSRHRARMTAGKTVAAATISVALLAGLTPIFGDGLLALFLPVKAWNGTLLPKMEFRGLPHQVMRGEDLTLDIVAPRRSRVTLVQRTTGEGWRTSVIPVARDGSAKAHVGAMRGDLMVVVSDGRASTDTALVRVTDRPFVGAISMRANYPAYLGRAPEGLPVGEPARVPQGTVVDIAGRASTELKTVQLVGPKDAIALRPSGHAFTGRFTATQTAKWSWTAVGSLGPIADVPLPLELEVVPDSVPRVELVSPATDTLVAGGDRIPLRLTVTDDHGIARVELQSWKQGAGIPVVQTLTGPQSTLWNGVALLDLAPRDLQPGDALHVKVVAIDNSPWAQKGESRELLLKIPTMEERRAMARDAADSAVREAQSTASAQKSLQQRTDDASKDRGQRANSSRNGESSASSDSKANGGQQSSMSFESAEQARAVAKEQRALTDRVKNLEQQAAALQQQLKQAGALDSSLARQLRDAQDLLRQALTPELMEQMKKLEDAAQQLSGDQARQAMKDLAAMQQRLREQLEKSAEMLKRAAFEGSMQTLKDEAKDIADRERKLADSAKASGNKRNDTQQDQAKQLADRSDRFSDEVKKLEDRLAREKAEPGAKRADQARQHSEASAEKMKEAVGERRQQNAEQSNGRDSSKASDGKPNEQRAGQGQQQRQSGDQAHQRQAANQEQRQSGQQSNQSQSGQQNSESQNSQSQNGQKSGQSQSGQQSASASQRGQQAKQPQRGQQGQRGQSKEGQQGQQGQDGQQGQQGNMQEKARDAAGQMDQAAQAMQDARDAQVSEWKKELTGDLDQTIQELLQMAREESSMEQKARSGDGKPDEMRGQQSAVKQGVDEAAQRMEKAGQKSSLLSGRSQRAMSEAQQKVAQATQQMSEQRGAQQSAGSLSDAAESLNRAAASLARDRERVNTASSASGFSEMLQQLQEMAKKQGSINAQAQGLMPMPGGQMSSEMQATARALARQQRGVAQQLDEMGEGAGGDRAAQLAKEARQLADALDGGRIDGTTLARQQQLFRRLLDAGRSLEKDEREDTNKREAKSAKGDEQFTPTNTDAKGKNASKFREPDWNELRGLTADERRAILDYFKRINEQKP
ncbi:MAG: Ig-like domain-containing protein [Gemmatimonadaceae bacterium]